MEARGLLLWGGRAVKCYKERCYTAQPRGT
jgi:hypothetical protein